MRGGQYLAEGYHVDDAGNLICSTYVDFREPDERAPVTALQKASAKRHAVPDRAFSTAHKSRTVYHGPVVYADDPVRRLERASSDLELLLLLVFLKHDAHQAQREYRFAVWAEDEPAEDRLDLEVSPALLDAMQRPRPEPKDSGFVSPGVAELSAVEAIGGGGPSGSGVRVDTRPALVGITNPAAAPQLVDAESLRGEHRETASADAAIEALRETVTRADVGSRTAAAAAAWHAEPIVRFLSAAFGAAIVAVRVSEDGFIVVTAELSGNGPVEAGITVGPDGTCACRLGAGGGHLASTAPDARSFEQVLRERLAEVGVRGRYSDA